jgi:hypothetical protein
MTTETNIRASENSLRDYVDSMFLFSVNYHLSIWSRSWKFDPAQYSFITNAALLFSVQRYRFEVREDLNPNQLPVRVEFLPLGGPASGW